MSSPWPKTGQLWNLKCAYTIKRWSSPLRFSVNVTQHDWSNRLHMTSLSSTCNFMSMFLNFDGVVSEEQRHSSERNRQCPSPQDLFHPHCPCLRGCPERKVTWVVLKACISFCHSVTESGRRQRYGHLRDAHSATRQCGITVPPRK